MFHPIDRIQALCVPDFATAASIFRSRHHSRPIIIPATVAASVLSASTVAATTTLDLGWVGRGLGIAFAITVAMALSHHLVLRSLSAAARHQRCLRCNYGLRELPDDKGRRICPESGLSNPAIPNSPASPSTA